MIKVSGIENESIVDGPGIRYVLFVQGCSHRCKGCHNPETWPKKGGVEMTAEEIYRDIKKNPNLSGVTFSGGEPFEQVIGLLELARLLKNDDIHLMSYSGYTLEELLARRDPYTKELLTLLDILVDGPYIESQRNLTLQYRGSENQRVIDMKKSEPGNITLYQSEYEALL